MKLNQVIAVEKGTKSKANSNKSELYKAVQKPALFDGFHKKYSPKTEGDEVFPPESKKVQVSVPQALTEFGQQVAQLIDIELTKDIANCEAMADVVVGGQTILTKAPVTFLLSLEKELKDLHDFFSHLPVLDPSEDWSFDGSSGLFKTEASRTTRTKKIQKPIVLYPATDKHPAQTQLITEDEIVGYWDQVKFSGAIPEPVKRQRLARLEELQKAVKTAREHANLVETNMQSIGQSIIDWLFK